MSSFSGARGSRLGLPQLSVQEFKKKMLLHFQPVPLFLSTVTPCSRVNFPLVKRKKNMGCIETFSGLHVENQVQAFIVVIIFNLQSP
jgi:hypothetical protein